MSPSTPGRPSPSPSAAVAADETVNNIPNPSPVPQSPTRITMTRGLSSSSTTTASSPSSLPNNNDNVDLRTRMSLVDIDSSKSGSESSSSSTASASEQKATPPALPIHGGENFVGELTARPSPLTTASSSSSTTTTTSSSSVAAAHQAGILASGLAWVDRQREKRRRQYLQMQAEQQLQKIKEAERSARRKKAASGSGSGSDQQDQQQRHPCWNSGDGDYNCGTGDVGITGPSGSDRSGIGKRGGKGGGLHADVSKSGEGATCRLDLSDLDTSDEGGGYDNSDSNYEDCIGDYTDEDYSDAYDNSNKSVDGAGYDNDQKYDISDENDDDDEFPIPPVRIEKVAGDDDPNNPFILTEDQMHQIACRVLPKTVAFCRWRRLYGLGRDGDSFDGCLRIIGDAQRTLMVVRTSKGNIFGGYAESPWHSHAQHGDARFFGGAAACLYSFGTDDNLTVYKWSGMNRYIQLCDVSHKMIAFGGGGDDGAFGLCVQDDFQRGSTGPCDTFDNDPLCPEDNFDIVDVEFWEFMTGVF